MKRRYRIMPKLYIALMLVFLYAPIAVLMVYSFNQSRTMANWGGFSLKWYQALFKDPEIMKALWVTVSCALLTAVISTAVGTLAAIGINSMKKRNRSIVMAVTNLPVINPEIVTGISMMLLFIMFSVPMGYFTLLLSHITFSLPYVILSVMPRLKQSSDQLFEAALDLGATPSYALWRVVVPEIAPGIITGALLAFTLSLDDFVISFFTRQGVQNLSILIYSMARRGINPKINALSTIMFTVILVLLLIVNIRGNREKEKSVPAVEREELDSAY